MSIEIIKDELGRDIQGIVDGEWGGPKHPHSFRREFDEHGNMVAEIFGEDPEYPRSWKMINGIKVYGDGYKEEV